MKAVSSWPRSSLPLERGGLSLLEMLVASAIIGVLLSVGAWMLDRRGLELNRALGDLQNLIQVARFEAIRGNQTVLLRFSPTQAFVDTNSDGLLSSGERALELSEYGPDLRLEASISGATAFRWSPQGLPIQALTDGFAAGSITVYNNSKSLRLCLSAAGRLRRLAAANEGLVNCQ